ncbi:MAG: HAD-IA family hydrolase [Pseudomonadota bacterium]
MKYETKSIRSIIFDLDGTLVNTVPDVLLSLNHTLATFGRPMVDESQILGMIGNGARFLMENAFTKSKIPYTHFDIDAALACYLKYYSENPIVATRLYPDVVRLLQQFYNAGITLSICTNKPRVIARLLLEELNLNQYFSIVLCGDEVSYPKPNAQHVFDIINRTNGKLAEAVLVGDSLVDKICAENAGIPFIGVSYGYDLDATANCVIIDNFNELPDALNKVTLEEAII